MMPTGDEYIGRENRTDRFEVVRHWGPLRQTAPRRELFFIWDRQKRSYVDSSSVEAEMLDLRDVLNERDRQDWDYGKKV